MIDPQRIGAGPRNELRWSALAFFAALAVGSLAARPALALNLFGLKPATSGQPTPPGELRALDYFRGSWICTGVVEPRGDKPAHLTNGKATYKWDLGNFFEVFTNQDVRSKDDPTPRSDRGFLGYDSGTKEFTITVLYVGGGRLVAASPPWANDGLKFMGESTRGGERMQIEQSITRKSDSEYFSVLEAVGSDGKRTRLFHEKCLRNGR